MEIRPAPIRTPRRIPLQLVVAVVLLALAAVTVGFSLVRPGGLQPAQLSAAAGASGAPSVAPSAAPDRSGKPDRSQKGRAFGFGFGNGNGASAAGRGGFGSQGGLLGAITIATIDGAKVTLKSATGWSRTIDTAGVAITRAGLPIAVGDLKVGDHVAIDQSRGSDGTYTVKGLSVVLDEVGGTVSKIDANSITVTRGKKTWTITTGSVTVYRRDGQTISRGDIAVGQSLTAVGTTDASGALAAEAIDVQPDMVMGTVTKISGSTLTISTPGGGTATVVVTSKTAIKAAGKSTATIADIAVKDVVVAMGVKDSDGTLRASSVRAGAWRAASPNEKGNGKGPKWWGGDPSPSASATTSG